MSIKRIAQRLKVSSSVACSSWCWGHAPQLCSRSYQQTRVQVCGRRARRVVQYEKKWRSQSTLEFGLSRNHYLMQLYECRRSRIASSCFKSDHIPQEKDTHGENHHRPQMAEITTKGLDKRKGHRKKGGINGLTSYPEVSTLLERTMRDWLSLSFCQG